MSGLVIWMEGPIKMIDYIKSLFKPKLVNSELNETEIKVLSRYLINQQTVINSLTEQNMKLTAEVQVLRDIINDLDTINNDTVKRALKLKEAKRKASPFRN